MVVVARRPKFVPERESTCCGARMSEDEVENIRDEASKGRCGRVGPQSVVEVEARFVVSGCEGCAEETREERERGAKVSGERRESEEGGRAVRRVRLSEP